MTTFFEHQRASYKKNYMKNLIALASSDGLLDENERELIFKIGKARGLKDWQINNLLEETTQQEKVFLPESLPNRMDLLYDFMQVIYADNEVSSSEMTFITDIVANFDLRPEIVHHLIDLFQYGTPARDEWNEFVEHISEAFLRDKMN